MRKKNVYYVKNSTSKKREDEGGKLRKAWIKANPPGSLFARRVCAGSLYGRYLSRLFISTNGQIGREFRAIFVTHLGTVRKLDWAATSTLERVDESWIE